MRSPRIVALQIAQVVPEEHKQVIMDLVNDFLYKAREQDKHCWRRLGDTCNELLLDADWKKKMIELLIDRSL